MMLREVVQGASFRAVGNAHAVSATTVERRIKGVALQLCQQIGIDGLNADGAIYVRRLRHHRDEILQALAWFQPPPTTAKPRTCRILSRDEVRLGARRIHAISSCGLHDLSLYFLLFATGAWPLEITQLQVRDFLRVNGQIRWESTMRAEIANNRRARPLLFCNDVLNTTLLAYLDERRCTMHGLGDASTYRGHAPESRLIVRSDGQDYPIIHHEPNTHRAYRCGPILEAYRRIFRQTGISGLNVRTAHLSTMAWLYQRGADEDQVGLLLGIRNRWVVRSHLARPQQTLQFLAEAWF